MDGWEMVQATQGVAPEIVLLGRRLRRKVLLALALSSALPALLLVYLVVAYALPSLDPTRPGALYWLEFVLASTLLAVAAGAYVLWGLGRTVAGVADALARQAAVTGLATRGDEVGTLMRSLGTMLATVEQQAAEINAFAARLDAAYQELEATNAKLKETSFKDEVTGLYNRRFFTLRLEEEMSRFRRFNHPVSIVLLDLDGFKSVNDQMGHTVGDAVLREVGQILVKHSRGINVVSRYGGDEFAVLLVETSKAGARLYADRIRQVVATYPFSNGKTITASFGVASLPDDEVATADELFRAADDALYAAKRAGKNQVMAAGNAAKVG